MNRHVGWASILGPVATVYYTASSLDGYIVDEADSLDWLISRDIDPSGPFHYDTFLESVGALAMGSATYEWVVRNHPGEWMYQQPTWVLTQTVQCCRSSRSSTHSIRSPSANSRSSFSVPSSDD